MVIGIRVEAENIQTGESKHCNSSYITMVAKDKNGKGTKVPGLILSRRKSVLRFLKSMKRTQLKRKRDEEFHHIDFDSAEFQKELEKYRVQVELND